MPSYKKKIAQDLVAAAAMRSSLERVPTIPLNPHITRSSVIALHVGALVAL